MASFDKVSGSSGKGRNWWLIGGIGCFALFVCVCLVAIGALFLIPPETVAQFRQLAGLQQEASSIDYVPANAPLYVAVNPNFTQAANAKKIWELFANNPEYKKRFEEAQKSATTDSDFDFERDVRPWVGTEIGIALMDMTGVQQAINSSGSSAASTPPNLVIIVPTRDKAKSDAALAAMRKREEGKSTTFSEEKYKDVTITIGKTKGKAGQPDSTNVYATYQGQVMLATTTDAIKKAIDTKAGGDTASLKNSTQYKTVVEKLPKDRAATLYADIAAFSKAIMATTPRTTPPSPFTNLNMYEGFLGFGLAVSFAEEGVRFDHVSTFDRAKMIDFQKKATALQKADAGKVLELMPASTMIGAGAQDLKGYWELVNDIIKQDPQTSKSFEQGLRDIKTQTGIDVNEDIFSWMTGEYGISIMPAKRIPAAGPDAPAAGFVLLIEAKDQALAKSKLDKIAQAFAKQRMTFSTKKVSGVDMQIIKELESEGITAGYGFVDNYVVIASADDVFGSVVDGKKSPLSGDPEYQKVVKQLPQPYTGVAFVSIPRIVELAKPLMSKSQLDTFQKETEPLLKLFKSIIVGAAVPQDNLQTGVFFIRIAE
jgi:hypothetical protein